MKICGHCKAGEISECKGEVDVNGKNKQLCDYKRCMTWWL